MAKILIIDDDAVYMDMTRQRLERAGHEVVVHLGPFGATVAARDASLDLILLDVFMPALSGPDLLDLMLKKNPASQAPVVFCSSMDRGPLAALAAEHAAAGYIPKSADKSEFLDAVSAALTLRKRYIAF